MTTPELPIVAWIGNSRYTVSEERSARYTKPLTDHKAATELLQAANERILELERDAARYRWLRDRMIFYNTKESTGPFLASVAKRIWYHATDDMSYPLDAAIDAGLVEAPQQPRQEAAEASRPNDPKD